MAQFEVGGERNPFLGYTDLPLYGRGPGWLQSGSTNFRVMPGGYLQARGGFEEIKPSGGTGADPASAGIYTGGHEHSMADGYIYTYETTSGAYSGNFAQRGYFEIFSASDDEEDDAIYIGSTVGQFSRVVFFIAQGTAGASPPTLNYEYAKTAAWDTDGTAASSGDLTLTSTPDFGSTGEQVMEWAIPSDWVRAVRNGIYAYWVRIRIETLNDGYTTAVRQGGSAVTVAPQKVYCDWPGTREIYVASAAAAAATNNGTLKRYGQSSDTVVSWTSINTALFSGNYPRVRFASYKNVMYFVNGKETKRWDGKTLADIGFTAPSAAAYATNGTTGSLSGTYAWAITYGYGPNGEWGESGEQDLGARTFTAPDDLMNIDMSGMTHPEQAEVIYLYRTTDMTSVVEQSSFPKFRVKSVYRQADGTFSAAGTADITDGDPSFPFPPVELNVATRTPPTRCQYIATHKNRLFLGSNNQYPGRVWWSEPFEAEAFIQDENFADFTRSTGGQVTGMTEFNDQIVVFTEDQMFGIANVDQDIPSIYVINPGIGCVSPDSIQVGFGVMCWLARNGVYVWDGQEPPRRVSDHTTEAFGKMSFETHGGSRCLLHDRQYDIYLLKPDGTEVVTPRFRYDLVTDSWSKVTLGSSAKIGPIAHITAPPGHADAGVRHGLWGLVVPGGSDFGIYISEYTTQDDGNNFTCTANVHFGPMGAEELNINRAYAYYDKDSGWGTPTLNNKNTTAGIGDTFGTINNMTVDGGTDYTRLSGIPAEGSLGSGDVVIQFTATSASGGTAGAQKLLAVGLDADRFPASWGKS